MQSSQSQSQKSQQDNPYSNESSAKYSNILNNQKRVPSHELSRAVYQDRVKKQSQVMKKDGYMKFLRLNENLETPMDRIQSFYIGSSSSQSKVQKSRDL